MADAVSMNLTTALGDGVEPYSEQVRDRKKRKLQSKWMSLGLHERTQPRDNSIKVLWAKAENQFYRKVNGVILPFVPTRVRMPSIPRLQTQLLSGAQDSSRSAD